jgi:hypothetical protein
MRDDLPHTVMLKDIVGHASYDHWANLQLAIRDGMLRVGNALTLKVKDGTTIGLDNSYPGVAPLLRALGFEGDYKKLGNVKNIGDILYVSTDEDPEFKSMCTRQWGVLKESTLLRQDGKVLIAQAERTAQNGRPAARKTKALQKKLKRKRTQDTQQGDVASHSTIAASHDPGEPACCVQTLLIMDISCAPARTHRQTTTTHPYP